MKEVNSAVKVAKEVNINQEFLDYLCAAGGDPIYKILNFAPPIAPEALTTTPVIIPSTTAPTKVINSLAPVPTHTISTSLPSPTHAPTIKKTPTTTLTKIMYLALFAMLIIGGALTYIKRKTIHTSIESIGEGK